MSSILRLTWDSHFYTSSPRLGLLSSSLPPTCFILWLTIVGFWVVLVEFWYTHTSCFILKLLNSIPLLAGSIPSLLSGILIPPFTISFWLSYFQERAPGGRERDQSILLPLLLLLRCVQTNLSRLLTQYRKHRITSYRKTDSTWDDTRSQANYRSNTHTCY